MTKASGWLQIVLYNMHAKLHVKQSHGAHGAHDAPVQRWKRRASPRLGRRHRHRRRDRRRLAHAVAGRLTPLANVAADVAAAGVVLGAARVAAARLGKVAAALLGAAHRRPGARPARLLAADAPDALRAAAGFVAAVLGAAFRLAVDDDALDSAKERIREATYSCVARAASRCLLVRTLSVSDIIGNREEDTYAGVRVGTRKGGSARRGAGCR